MSRVAYRLLLLALPGWFREEFGREMTAVFGDSLRDAWRRSPSTTPTSWFDCGNVDLNGGPARCRCPCPILWTIARGRPLSAPWPLTRAPAWRWSLEAPATGRGEGPDHADVRTWARCSTNACERSGDFRADREPADDRGDAGFLLPRPSRLGSESSGDLASE